MKLFDKFKTLANRIRLGLRKPRVRRTRKALQIFPRKNLHPALPDMKKVVHPAMEELTNQLREEVTGKGGLLDQEFEKMIQGYDPEVNPISRDEAELMIQALLRRAISHRKLLNDRIARSIESGRLFDQYYDRIHAVSALAVDAHTKMQKMDFAEENLRYHYDMLIEVRDDSFTKVPKPGSDEWGKLPNRSQDILKAIDEAAGM